MGRSAPQDIQFYSEFAKIDEEKRMVFGLASTETRDRQGEIVTRGAIEEALPSYMLWKNIREMHKPIAIGTAVEATMVDKGLWLGAHVVDDQAWKKVKAAVYKGFSIGGRVLSRDKSDPTIVNKIEITEISIVDRPANPDAVFELIKRSGSDLVLQPLQIWACGCHDHQHIQKSEAATCMRERAETLFSHNSMFGELVKYNQNHHPAGDEKGGQFAESERGGFGAEATDAEGSTGEQRRRLEEKGYERDEKGDYRHGKTGLKPNETAEGVKAEREAKAKEDAKATREVERGERKAERERKSAERDKKSEERAQRAEERAERILNEGGGGAGGAVGAGIGGLARNVGRMGGGGGSGPKGVGTGPVEKPELGPDGKPKVGPDGKIEVKDEKGEVKKFANAAEFLDWLRKAYNPNQPREPKGSSIGGQFAAQYEAAHEAEDRYATEGLDYEGKAIDSRKAGKADEAKSYQRKADESHNAARHYGDAKRHWAASRRVAAENSEWLGSTSFSDLEDMAKMTPPRSIGDGKFAGHLKSSEEAGNLASTHSGLAASCGKLCEKHSKLADESRKAGNDIGAAAHDNIARSHRLLASNHQALAGRYVKLSAKHQSWVAKGDEDPVTRARRVFAETLAANAA